MSTMEPTVSSLTIDPELAAAVREWIPREGSRPTVEIESREDGQRVKITYLEVETGVLFLRGTRVKRTTVQGTLDELFGILSWRVTAPTR